MINFTAVLLKRNQLINTSKLTKDLEAEMDSFTEQFWDRCQTYEVPPRIYRRTYKLKRSWTHKAGWQSGNLVGEVMSPGSVVNYNIKVRGKKGNQMPLHAAHGWLAIDTLVEDEWPKEAQRFRNVFANAVK